MRPKAIRLEFVAILALAGACGHARAYDVQAHFTPAATEHTPPCTLAGPTYRVPQQPVANRVLGDLVLSCKQGCPQEHAEAALLDEAHRLGASHVSSLSCVRNDDGWQCVGRASAPERCDEDS